MMAHRTCCGCLDRRRERATIACPFAEGPAKDQPVPTVVRCRKRQRLAPYRESGYRHLMRALARSGNTAEALRTYEQLRTLLRDELGIAPCSKTLQLHAELLSAHAPAAG
jgi:pentatricopeptide repeat protein